MGNTSSGGGGGGGHAGSVSQHVERARKTGVCSLRDHKLSRFPEQLLSVRTTLRTLDLSTNRLTAVPPNIAEFGNLRSLNLSHNKIADLPDSIGELKKLETLNLAGNGLSSLPEGIINLKVLKTVNLSQNSLQSFPLFLCQLTHLDFADLSDNKIEVLPEGVEVLNAVELNVNRNSISVIPASLARCRRLKVLRIEENTLSLMGLPPAILSDSSISLLCTEGNLFEVRELKDLPEYAKYMERYTATKRKAD